MVCASKPFIAGATILLAASALWADRIYMSETKRWNRPPMTVVAKGQLAADGASYTFALHIENNPTPTLHLGDRVRVSNLGAATFSPITWWQNGRRYAGKSCRGFLFRTCKKTYHNYQNEDKENYSVDKVRFGLKPLTKKDCRDNPKVGLNEELIVTFPSRLCVIGEGRFPRPAVVHGDGNPEGPVQVSRKIDDAGQKVFFFSVEIVREIVKGDEDDP